MTGPVVLFSVPVAMAAAWVLVRWRDARAVAFGERLSGGEG
jgi:hypothetical protein